MKICRHGREIVLLFYVSSEMDSYYFSYLDSNLRSFFLNPGCQGLEDKILGFLNQKLPWKKYPFRNSVFWLMNLDSPWIPRKQPGQNPLNFETNAWELWFQ